MLAPGAALGVAAALAPGTQFEAARDGLFVMGLPLVLLGMVLLALDWMASYNAIAQASWGHHTNRAKGRTPRAARARRRLGVFKPSEPLREFEASEAEPPLVGSATGPQATAAFGAADGAEALQTLRAGQPPRAPQGLQATATRAAAAVPRVTLPAAASLQGLDTFELPVHPGRVEPGPDTVIEEYVGYEGQDRMLALRDQKAPSPRELAWPNPPRTNPAETLPVSNEVFLERLMDDVLDKIGSRKGPAPQAQPSVPAPRAMPPSVAPAVAPQAKAIGPSSSPPVAPVHVYPAAEPATAPTQALPAVVWTRQMLEGADHWRFAAMVEKLYQQAGFATQLQAGATGRGAVVLWLFSRHRPGMPASVVSCVHAPGGRLPTEEIIALSELVKSRGLPRGQLATNATLDENNLQAAAGLRVHLMDSTRLLELINQRNAEQQRALAARLA